MKDILVFFGGKSCEHDVSIITGVLTLNSLDKTLYNPVPVYITQKGEWLTGNELKNVSFYKQKNFSKLKRVTLISGDNSLYYVLKNKLKKCATIYSAINCLHGLNGEDGTLKGMLKLIGIPTVSPGVFQSAFTIDKQFTKIVLSGLKIKTLPFTTVNQTRLHTDKQKLFNEITTKLGYPVIVKPCNLGSSIGIGLASCDAELEKALKTAFLYDDKAVVERALNNPVELNCSAYSYGNKTVISQVEKPVKTSDILSFADKYYGFKGCETGREFPAKISDKLCKKVQETTAKIYEELNFTSIIRIDYLLDGTDLYVNEINSVPGSLAYYLFGDLKHFTSILTSLIKDSVHKEAEYLSRRFTFSSSVLEIEGAKGGAKNL
ncbi:MAG: hypothetical protein IKL82_01350 [Clostridia bacterium]|nr:hypothetical protein [Clostridia bacterium]